MKASVVDLRYRMSDILKALDRDEIVEVLYHGKTKGKIIPVSGKSAMRVKDHPFFNMTAAEKSVDEVMDNLRGGRYHNL
ncbi:MAG: hypothetical protein J7L76_05310 [Spirochaetaceae bacterium]|nr:hypothetical protein [Spirochaetaceae bacterium]RKX73853.1 MAG: type II toxin-antitoxin system Phd/YefM family antitoxin [Spirochaetota bacterium]RKX85240.1 MAG: type II toxin-antitoxin system Phd/YefM family antitoxin [Spirochaetota bacterium]RKX91204.1 MAG: type II toxin-antitoxin system Phd/YefM family antitoxin [Spirochaetota bacterium]